MKIANPLSVKKRILEYKARAPLKFSYSTGAMINDINKATGKDAYRRLIFGWLFNDELVELSSQKLHRSEWYSLKMWIKARPAGKNEAGKMMWKPRDAFTTEARWIITVLHALQNGVDLGEAIRMVQVDEAHNPLVTSTIALGGSVQAGSVLMSNEEWKEASVEYHKKYYPEGVRPVQQHRADNGDGHERTKTFQSVVETAEHEDDDLCLLRLLRGT